MTCGGAVESRNARSSENPCSRARMSLNPWDKRQAGETAPPERVWFGEAVTGASRAELGIPDTPDESFDLQESDTIESVLADHAAAIEQSRRAVAGMDGDTVLPGNRRGPLPLRWVQQHLLRELAQHCGHADLLRELILASRSRPQE